VSNELPQVLSRHPRRYRCQICGHSASILCCDLWFDSRGTAGVDPARAATRRRNGGEMRHRQYQLVCDVTSIQNYVAQQAFGLNPSPEIFTRTKAGCGNQVSASYTFEFAALLFPPMSPALSAQACFRS